MTTTHITEAGPSARGAGFRRVFRLTPYLGFLPFFALVVVFLLWPTYLIVSQAFIDSEGNFTLSFVSTVLTEEVHQNAFKNSIQVSAITALAGAFLGGLFAWAIATSRSDGVLRRVTLAGSGVLAQFGGVMLAFAFLATFGFNGMVTIFFAENFGDSFLSNPTWLYDMTGLAVVYTFFQIPLMLIVFLPAVEGLRIEWREANDSLGGSTWDYWKSVAGPILFPSFLGALLLLFANAFSAYATAAALISQGSPIVPLQIRGAIGSEVALGNAALGKALALGMVIIVIVVMGLYVLLQRRVGKWAK